MKYLFECANTYIKESDWKTIALLKICLCAMGVMIGLMVSRGKRKPVFFIAMVIFLTTYIPLILKMVEIAKRGKCRI